MEVWVTQGLGMKEGDELWVTYGSVESQHCTPETGTFNTVTFPSVSEQDGFSSVSVFHCHLALCLSGDVQPA